MPVRLVRGLPEPVLAVRPVNGELWPIWLLDWQLLRTGCLPRLCPVCIKLCPVRIELFSLRDRQRRVCYRRLLTWFLFFERDAACSHP